MAENIPTNPVREAFVLRVWSDSPGSQGWRAQLQHVRSGELVAFQDLEEMFVYIRSKISRDISDLESGLR